MVPFIIFVVLFIVREAKTITRNNFFNNQQQIIKLQKSIPRNLGPKMQYVDILAKRRTKLFIHQKITVGQFFFKIFIFMW